MWILEIKLSSSGLHGKYFANQVSHALSLLFILKLLDRVAVLQDGAPGLGVVTVVHCTSVPWWPRWGHIPLSNYMTWGLCLILIAVNFVSMPNSAVKIKRRG